MLAHRVAQAYGLHTQTVDFEDGPGRVVGRRTHDTHKRAVTLMALDVSPAALSAMHRPVDRGQKVRRCEEQPLAAAYNGVCGGQTQSGRQASSHGCCRCRCCPVWRPPGSLASMSPYRSVWIVHLPACLPACLSAYLPAWLPDRFMRPFGRPRRMYAASAHGRPMNMG
eukprot:146845-Chlamydomonas_euryale.AAC.1